MIITKINLNKIKPYCMSFVVLVMGYFLLLKQEMEQYNELCLDEITLRQQFKIKQQRSVDIMTYKKELQTISAYRQSMFHSLTLKKHIPELLNAIYNTGLDNGVSFELFSPLPEIEHDGYIEVPISMTVIGDYQSLMAFLSHVAHFNQLVTWDDFTLKHASKQGEPDLLILTLKARLYRTRS